MDVGFDLGRQRVIEQDRARDRLAIREAARQQRLIAQLDSHRDRSIQDSDLLVENRRQLEQTGDTMPMRAVAGEA
jgi:hypothetical protein